MAVLLASSLTTPGGREKEIIVAQRGGICHLWYLFVRMWRCARSHPLHASQIHWIFPVSHIRQSAIEPPFFDIYAEYEQKACFAVWVLQERKKKYRSRSSLIVTHPTTRQLACGIRDNRSLSISRTRPCFGCAAVGELGNRKGEFKLGTFKKIGWLATW